MKNIRIIALLMFVIMIATTCSGCVSFGNNDELEGRVDEIDTQLQEQADALANIQTAIDALTNALENQTPAPEVNLDDVYAGIDENKQNIADILAAIEALQKALEDLADKEDEAATNAEAVKNAIAQADAKVEAMEAAFELVKAHYTAEAVVAIRGIFGEASVALAACTSVSDIATVLAKLDTALGAYSRVDDSIYAYVVALTGNISDKTADAVKNAVAALNDAKVFYANNMKALTEYKVTATQTINLVKTIEEIEYAQTILYPQAVLEAKAINNAIAKYKPLQQTSVVYLVTEIGGFYKVQGGKLVEVTTTELNKQIADDDDVTTIALFVAKYTKYGFGNLVDVVAYNAAQAAVEANIAKMEIVLKAFLDSYKTVLGKEETLVVTTENMNTVFGLEAFLDAWTMIGRTDFVKVVYAGTNYNVKEYAFESILAKHKITATELNEMVEIVENWLADANQIKFIADMAVTLYNLVNRINAIDNTVYNFANLEMPNSLAAKGITSLASAVKADTTTWTVSYVTVTSDGYAIKTETIDFNGTKEAFVDYFVANYHVISAIDLVETAMYVETVFTNDFNNGKVYAPITSARNGWLTEKSAYGFGYVRYMTYQTLLGFGDIEDRDIKALAQTTNYDELRSAVYAIYGRSGNAKWTTIAFGDLVIYDCE